MLTKKQSGNMAKEAASRYLVSKGYKILERNYFARGGEIDIIAQDNDVLVFVEVKHRVTDFQGYGFQAVTKAKQHKICNAAKKYFFDKNLSWDRYMRFDVIDVFEGEITHYEGAFMLT
ncbi:MAG: YraN family protein [Clostridiales bacterium]|nr:YraN family protein [Clostridiales bacterium]